MRTLAHIINPVKVGPSSDLHFAQPITFESLRVAREFACGDVDVTLFTAQYPQDRPMVSDGFTPTPDLDRSILDIADLTPPRRLPLLADVLGRLYEATDAEFLIYTNVDIAVLPAFYAAVSRLIDDGYDSFVINRRTISDQHRRVDELPLMYSKVGKKHPGHDCFVSKRESFQNYDLGRVCIGMAWVAKALLINMAYTASRFQIFTDEHLTFHIGDPRPWTNPAYADYRAHNHKEFITIRRGLQQKYGRLVMRLSPGSNIPPMFEERVPWFKSMVKRAAPEPVYAAAKKVYRTIRPLREV